MNLLRPNPRRRISGSLLVMVLVFLTVSLVVLVAALGWTQTSTQLTGRHNQYFRTVAAAEAATEKVLARVTRDYQDQGESLVFSSLDSYRGLVPETSESPLWAAYEFRSPQGQLNQTHVEYIPPSEFRLLSSAYRGLRGYASTLRIISNVREVNGRFPIVAAVKQDVEIATVPVFQFAIFYNTDLEINPGAAMTISGPVHCNTNIYLQPQSTLTFNSDVTAVAAIIHNKKPGDPIVRSGGSIVFNGEHDGGVSTLTLPIGTNSSPAAVRAVVEIPPDDEAPTSAMGRERYYNKADLIIRVTDGGVTVTSGRFNNFATVIPAAQYQQFLDTSASFYNKRENKTIQATQIDVGKLRQWNETNTLLRPVLTGSDLRTVYVVDSRTQTSATQAGVRLVNGQELPPRGLTVATPHPLYIKGHYNAPSSALGTADTSQTRPASVVADAVTVLSTAWNDANSGLGLSSRTAANTTVNAAFLAGIVPTTSGSYSGGVENFPRFLENWSGRTFTYNGSMVVLFESLYATGPWRGTGSTIGIYNPPVRNWAFDTNFRDPNKVPPGCPSVRVLIRGRWETIRPNCTS
jgi:hypothetical protein